MATHDLHMELLRQALRSAEVKLELTEKVLSMKENRIRAQDRFIEHLKAAELVWREAYFRMLRELTGNCCLRAADWNAAVQPIPHHTTDG